MASIIPATCKRLVQELVDYNQLPSGTSADQVKDVCLEKLECDSKASKESCLKTARQSVNGWFNTTLPEDKVIKPNLSYVEGQTPTQQCTAKCDEPYIAKQIEKSAWESCLEDCYLGKDIKEYKKRIDEVDRNRENRRSLNMWGRFAFKAGFEYGKFDRTYGYVSPYDSAGSKVDAQLKNNVFGTRLALTTEPGLTRISGNTFGKLTVFDVTFYGDEDALPYSRCDNNNHNDYYNDITPEKCNEKNDVPTVQENNVSSINQTRLSILEGELQIPFFDRNFVEVGLTVYKTDMLWQSNKILNASFGINYQIHGTPVTVDDRMLDAKGVAYILSSYAMLGIQFLGTLLIVPNGDWKKAALCQNRSINCSNYENAFQFNKLGNGPVDHEEQGTAQMTVHLFGEERGNGNGLSYKLYFDYFPRWQKAELGGKLGVYSSLGKAMEFFADLNIRGITSFSDDHNPFLPDSGFGTLISAGFALKPSAVF